MSLPECGRRQAFAALHVGQEKSISLVAFCNTSGRQIRFMDACPYRACRSCHSACSLAALPGAACSPRTAFLTFFGIVVLCCGPAGALRLPFFEQLSCSIGAGCVEVASPDAGGVAEACAAVRVWTGCMFVPGFPPHPPHSLHDRMSSRACELNSCTRYRACALCSLSIRPSGIACRMCSSCRV